MWLGKLFFAHGECMMPYFGEAAKGHKSIFSAIDEFSMQAAPSPESRLRQSNFSNEEFKHTYQFFKLYNERPERVNLRKFALIVAALLAASNMFAIYSYINIPLRALLAFNLVLFVEIIAVVLTLNYVCFTSNRRAAAFRIILIFLAFVIVAIAIQNIAG